MHWNQLEQETNPKLECPQEALYSVLSHSQFLLLWGKSSVLKDWKSGRFYICSIGSYTVIFDFSYSFDILTLVNTVHLNHTSGVHIQVHWSKSSMHPILGCKDNCMKPLRVGLLSLFSKWKWYLPNIVISDSLRWWSQFLNRNCMIRRY